MKNLIARCRPTKQTRRTILLLATVIFTLTLPLTSGQANRNDEVLGVWLFALNGDDANIEKYAIAQVQPPYPPTAQKFRIEGVVTVQVGVNKDGKVIKAEFMRGHTVFRSASLDAAKQWLFNAPSNNGLDGTINFTFKLK